MPDLDATPPIMTLSPSPARRTLGAAMQGTLGLLVLWFVAAYPPGGPVLRVFLVILGVAALLLAVRGWRAGTRSLILTEAGLFEAGDAGVADRVVAPIEAVVAVDRGAFAFKPSNGFLVRLDRPMGRAWIPGLWWRLGTRVGVGGTVSGAEARAVADALSAMASARRDRT